MTWGRKSFRKMFRRTHENGYNQYIHNRCKSPDIVPAFKVGSLKRVGHGVRTDDEGTAKKLLERQSNKEETKRVRPRLGWVCGWVVQVELDLNMGV